ncbi:MAG TPA: OprD family outer membrane porin [Campylobacterales bacterium]|mgnify:CR=1 FL=1|nr:OprD family outer membrane porin [Campylobacterales bacterium]
MYKNYKLIALSMLCASTMYADISYGGYDFFGEIRGGYVNYYYGNEITDTTAFAAVGKVGVQTKKYDGLYARVMGAGVSDFGISDLNKQQKSNIFKREDDGSRSNFAILQELYVGYANGKNELKIGRNEFDSPMIGKDDYYMLANSFESISLSSKHFRDIDLNVGYLHKMAGVWDSRSDGSNFRSMSDASMTTAVNKGEADNSGIYYAGVSYRHGHHKLSIWDYYAKELYNTLYIQYDYTDRAGIFEYTAGVQAIDFREVGKLSKSQTNINTGVYAAQVDAKADNGLLLNASVTKFGVGDGEQYVLGAWGGYAYYTKGFIFHFHEQNSFRNALGYKLQAGYDFSKIGAGGLSLNLRYTNFLLDGKYSVYNTHAQNYLRFYGAQIRYAFMRGGYLAATYEKGELEHVRDFNGFRLIGGYKF